MVAGMTPVNPDFTLSTATAAGAAADNTEKLNDLIEILKDGQLGFEAAADDAQSPNLKNALRKYSHQRAEFARQLQAVVVHRGEKPEDSGSLSGALHRGWINLKSAVATRDDLAVLEECERGEDFAVEAYRKALDHGELGAARSLISKQYTEIKAAHDEIRSMRDHMKVDAA